ncbi:MAG TPA: hypothetical protein VGG94_05290 [Chthoniobacterales bacterium]|jgi:hypothetical protein
MNNSDQFKLFLSTFAVQVPVLVVSLTALLVILIKWQQAPRGSLWALLAFGLTLVLCLVIPIGQAGVQSWAMQSTVPIATRASVFAGLGVAWSVLRAITYVLLLVAVYAGRPRVSE